MKKLVYKLEVSHDAGGAVSDALGVWPNTIQSSDDIWDALLAFGEAQGYGVGMPAGCWPIIDFPVVRLCITAAGFAPDFFQVGGLYYGSAAFRTAAEKAGARIQYAPVNMSGSTSAAHAKDYKVLNVVDATTAAEPESEGPLALQVCGPRWLFCTAAFATSMLAAGLEGVEIYGLETMTPTRPPPAVS